MKNHNIETAIASIQQLGKELATQRKDKPKIKPGFLTVSQFLHLYGRNLSVGDRILLGKMLNAFARDSGFKVIKRPNTAAVYPVNLLRAAMRGMKI